MSPLHPLLLVLLHAVAGDVKTDCAVSGWGIFGACSISCGGRGETTRVRSVQVKPSGGGQPCPLVMSETAPCRASTTPCPAAPDAPVDCSLSEWGVWGACSVTCGARGVTGRHRHVARRARNGGADGCAAQMLLEFVPCNEGPCPRHCVVSPWSSWFSCSASCQPGGKQVRVRSVVRRTAAVFQCPELWQTRACNRFACITAAPTPPPTKAPTPAAVLLTVAPTPQPPRLGSEAAWSSFSGGLHVLTYSPTPLPSRAPTPPPTPVPTPTPPPPTPFPSPPTPAPTPLPTPWPGSCPPGWHKALRSDAGEMGSETSAPAQPRQQVSQCKRCPAGRYQTFSGMPWHHLCFGCEAGRFAPHAGATACLPCPKGRFVLRSGQHSCRSCTKGGGEAAPHPERGGSAPQTQRWLQCEVWRQAAAAAAQSPLTAAPTQRRRRASPTHFDWSFLSGGSGSGSSGVATGAEPGAGPAPALASALAAARGGSKAGAAGCPLVTLRGKRVVVVRRGMPYHDAGAKAVSGAGTDVSSLIDAVVRGGSHQRDGSAARRPSAPPPLGGVRLSTLHAGRFTITYKIRVAHSAMDEVRAACDANAPVRTVIVHGKR